MADWGQDRDRDQGDDISQRPGSWNLVPERQVNLKTPRGEQDAANKIPYIEWSRGAKDHIKAKGKPGRVLVSIMDWAERMGDTIVTNEALGKLGLSGDLI